jgi:hypothetical protein
MTSSDATPDSLVALTGSFFERHWTAALGRSPVWLQLDPEDLSPDLDAGGCYAVADPNQRLLYVGLALAERRPSKPAARGGVIRRLYRHVIRRGALTRGQIIPKRTAWNEHGGIGSIWVLLFPAEFSYLAAGLEVFLIQELSGKLPINKSRVRTELAESID